MKKLKLFSLLLTLAMLVTAVNLTAVAEPVSVSFTLWGTNEGLTSVFDLVDSYNASQDEVEVTVNGIDPSVYFEKLNAFFASGSAPDVIQVAADYGEQYNSKGVFASLDEFMTDDLKSQFAASLLDALKYDGQQYAIPIGMQNSFIIYNKDLFDKAELAYPTSDWTEEAFLELAQKLTVPDEKQYGVLISGSVVETLLDMYGDYIYDWDTNTMTVGDNASFRHGLQMFYDMFVTDKVTPQTMSTKDIGGGFETGKYPMALIHNWDIASLSATIGDSFDWDIVQFPVNTEYGTRWNSPLYVQALSIANTCENKEAAFDFIQWWATQTEPQIAMSDSYPVCSTVLSDEAFLTSFPDGHVYDKSVVVKTTDEQGIPWWNTGVIAEINDNVFSPAVQKLLLQTEAVTVDETIQTIQEKGQQIFDFAD